MNNQQIQCHKITQGRPSSETYNLDIEASKKLSRMTLQLRFVFVRHCNLFFITSQLRFCLFGVVKFFDDVMITLYFGTLELRTEITL